MFFVSYYFINKNIILNDSHYIFIQLITFLIYLFITIINKN